MVNGGVFRNTDEAKQVLCDIFGVDATQYASLEDDYPGRRSVGFFAVGTVLCCAGLLVFSSNEGTFDMLVHGISSFVDLFRAQSKKKYHTFFDYRESRSGEKFPFAFLLICGLLFVAVSLVLLPLST